MADLPPRRRSRTPGRPRTGRVRRPFGVQYPQVLVDAMEEQAAEAGMRLSRYLELVVCSVHDIWTPFVQPPVAPLPLAIPMDSLRYKASHFTPEDLDVPAGGDVVAKFFRVDEAVAVSIDQRCDDYDVTYANYLRAVFRLATGLPTPQPPAAAHPLLPEGGDAGLAHAS